MLSLERRLPLVLTGVLLATLGTALLVTHRALVSGAEDSARRGLSSAMEVVGTSLDNSARLRAQQLEAAVDSTAVRRLLRDRSEPSQPALEAAEDAMEPVFTGTGDVAVQLLDATGRLVAHWGDEFDAELPATLRRAPPPPEGQDPAKAWHSPLLSVDGIVHYWSAVHVTDAMGQVIGTLATLRRVSTQQDLTRTLRNLTARQVTFFLRNSADGQWMEWPGRLAAPSVAESEESPRYATRDGVGRVIVIERPIEHTSWRAVIEVPLDAVRAVPVRTTRRLALIFLALALAGTLLTWRISRGVTHPLHQLTAGADALARGERAAPVTLDRTDELGQLAHSFNVMSRDIAASRAELEHRITEAERANRAKADFLAMMSHELRTPLNAIAGYTQLLEMGIHGPLTREQREALDRVGHSQRHLLHLIDDLLSFARIDAGRVEYTLTEVPLAASIGVVLSMVAPQARAKRITLDCACADESLTVYADREKLDQVLLNLLANAVKFTPPDGRVEISAGPVASRDEHGRELVQIRVSDTGPGVPADHRASIFEPFRQGDRALNRPSEGVGLGLAISRDLTEGMGGHLTLDSGESGGATFVVTLLRHAPADREVHVPSSLNVVPTGRTA